MPPKPKPNPSCSNRAKTSRSDLSKHPASDDLQQFRRRLLKDREQLHQQKIRLARKHQQPVLAISINTPGPDKRRPEALALFQLVIELLSRQIEQQQWTVLEHWDGEEICFPVQLWAVAAPPVELKMRCLDLETEDPAGRLFDLDVCRPDGTPISRADLGRRPRLCFICEDPAQLCCQSGRHPQQEVINRFLELAARRLRSREREA